MYINLNKDTTVRVQPGLMDDEYELYVFDGWGEVAVYSDLAGLQELVDGLKEFIDGERAICAGQGGPNSAPHRLPTSVDLEGTSVRVDKSPSKTA